MKEDRNAIEIDNRENIYNFSNANIPGEDYNLDGFNEDEINKTIQLSLYKDKNKNYENYGNNNKNFDNNINNNNNNNK
jgi:hypothetical protein